MAINPKEIAKLTTLQEQCTAFVQLSNNPYDTSSMDGYTQDIQTLLNVLKNVCPSSDTTTTSTVPTPTESIQEDSLTAVETAPPSIQMISASVGVGGVNNPADIRIVKEQLDVRMNLDLTEGNIEKMGPYTETIIRDFQERAFGWRSMAYSGLIEPNDATWNALVSSNAFIPPLVMDTDGGETHYNQRDDSVSHNGQNWTGSDTCSPNALAMKLMDLANGDEARLKQEAIAIGLDASLAGSDGEVTTVTLDQTMQLSEMLLKLSYKYGKSNGTYEPFQQQAPMEALAEAFSVVEYADFRNSDNGWATLEDFQTDVKTRLNNGEEISVSTRLTDFGHLGTIVTYRSDGIVFNDPYGARIDPNNNSYLGYIRNGEAINPHAINLITNNIEIFNRRFQHNTALKTQIEQLVEQAKKNESVSFPTNLGEQNFYDWEEVKAYDIGFGKYGTASKGTNP